MRKLPLIACLGVAASLGGAAMAASPKPHQMDVPLPDGGVVHVEYYGEVAPKVSVQPARPDGLWAPMAFPGFGNFDSMFDQLRRQMLDIQRAARHPAIAPGMNIASYGDLPAGASSVSVVSTSNGGVTCTRTTEIVSQGAGKPPKVTTNIAGDCASAPSQAAPATGGDPVDRT